MKNGVIENEAELKYIIECFPNFEYVEIRNKLYVVIWDLLYEKEVRLRFENPYSIKLCELITILKDLIWNQAYESGRHFQANEVKKVLFISQ